MSPESRMRTDRTDRRRVCEGEGRESEGTEGGRSDPANNRPGVHSRQLRSVGDDHGAGPRSGGWGRGSAFFPPTPSPPRAWGLQSAEKQRRQLWYKSGPASRHQDRKTPAVPTLRRICQASPPWCRLWKTGGLCTCGATLSPQTAGPRRCGFPHTHTDHTAGNAGKRGASGRLPSAPAKGPEPLNGTFPPPGSSGSSRPASTGLMQVCSNSLSLEIKAFFKESNITL